MPPSQFEAQVDRILRSPSLNGSEVLRTLVGFLARAAVERPHTNLKEYEIATEGLGRHHGFDPRVDSTVRVHMARLRARLAEHYERHGQDDPVLIEVPKGGYRLTGRFRSLEPPAASPRPAAGLAPIAMRWGWTLVGVAAAAALLSVASARTRPEPLGQLWSGFTSAGQPPLVVFSNPRFTGSAFTGMRYAGEAALSPEQVNDSYTGIGELLGSHALAHLFAGYGRSIDLKRSQLLTWDDARGRNLIFIGGPHANTPARHFPQLERFRFRTAPDGVLPPVGAIQDLRAAPGQPTDFSNSGRRYRFDHALVALVPGLSKDRQVLFLAGTTTLGTQAAAEFVCREESVRTLLAHLSWLEGKPLPWFEALLKVTITGDVPVQSDIVVVHVRDRQRSSGP